MGDGIINKYALIIDGGEEARFLEQVDLSLDVLDAQGYDTYVASGQRPQHESDHYTTATLDNIGQLIEEIKGRIDDDDELVIYVNGHGAEREMCLPDGCHPELAALLDIDTYGKRTVILTQCYNGRFNSLFYEDPRTLFIAPGSNGEIVDGDFGTNFWAANVADLNGDGIISWQERFANATKGRYDTYPQFVISGSYVSAGDPPFSTEVRDVSTLADLDEIIAGLLPGQYAVMDFSPEWCPRCREYEPVFDQLARDSQGQYLFLRTASEEIAEHYQISEFPSLMMFNDRGARYEIPYRTDPLRVAGLFYETEAERLRLSQQQFDSTDPIVRLSSAGNAYALARQKGELSPELADEIARVYREIAVDQDVPDVTRWSATSFYGRLAGFLSSEEAQRGAEVLRDLFTSDEVNDQIRHNAIGAYALIASQLFIDELVSGADALLGLIDPLREVGVAMAVRERTLESYSILAGRLYSAGRFDNEHVVACAPLLRSVFDIYRYRIAGNPQRARGWRPSAEDIWKYLEAIKTYGSFVNELGTEELSLGEQSFKELIESPDRSVREAAAPIYEAILNRIAQERHQDNM